MDSVSSKEPILASKSTANKNNHEVQVFDVILKMRKIRNKVQHFSNTHAAAYIREFGHATTLHGLPYIIKKNYHYSETLLWLLAVILATYGAAKLIYDSWNRYNSNPTVISLEKDFREWNLTFPAATVCFKDRLNETTAADLILEKWKIDQNSTQFHLYMKFLNAVTNLTYENLDDFSQFTSTSDFTSLSGDELTTMARQTTVQMGYHANIFDASYNHIKFLETLTEMGICYTYSGVVSNYHTLHKGGHPVHEIPYCNYLSSVCYTRVEDLPRPIQEHSVKRHEGSESCPYEIIFIEKYCAIVTCNFLQFLVVLVLSTIFIHHSKFPPSTVNFTTWRTTQLKYYIHSPYEIPAINDKFYDVENNMERDTTWRFSEMVASKELRRLEPRQRQCRFMDEPEEGEHVYSYNICKMGCRKKLAYRFCGCAPYFYMKGGDIPVCGVVGLACLSKYKENIVKLKNKDGSEAECNCLLQCEFVTFYIEEDRKRSWSYPVPPNIRFRWAIQHYSKTRQKRDIIFGFEDLLVSLGGTAALFLGCSVLSFVEVGYFFTLRLFWHLARKIWPKKKKTVIRKPVGYRR